jgi:hypothetical protein
MNTDGEGQDTKFMNPHQFEGKAKSLMARSCEELFSSVFIGVYPWFYNWAIQRLRLTG